jgi:transcription antitermination protein NusB
MSKRQRQQDRIARRVALWMLYGIDVTGRDAEQILRQSYSSVLELEPDAAGVWEQIERSVVGVSGKLESLNTKIQELSPRWRLDRMASIDRNILRLGVWELLEQTGSPVVVLNDCIELAKEYGDKGTPAFVNGLLDQLCKNNKLTAS